MDKLYIKDFKAFNEEITIDLNNKNILLYGENGAGKSSIYEAIKYIFFQNKIENDKIPVGSTPEEQNQYKSDIKSSYDNKKNGNPFILKINETEYDNFNKSQYEIFMISTEIFYFESTISLLDIIKKCYFTIDDIDNFLSNSYSLIQENVNENLKKTFKENIEISIDSADNYKCTIIDARRNFARNDDLRLYFNEAKLNLIILLLLFSTICLATNKNKKQLLVLDDFLSSMDAANRTFLTRYILYLFNDDTYQKIILTHNIGFYNLIMHTINKIDGQNNKWEFCCIYEINDTHRLYQKSHIERVRKIQDDYASGQFDLVDLGNRVRKKFEILLYEFSKLLLIGAVEETNKILELILNDKAIYLHESKTIYDLIDEIEKNLNNGIYANLQNRLKDKIKLYKKKDYTNLKAILKSLTLYQKVTMHPLSHGTIGLTPFSQKEFEESLHLLEILESKMKDYVDTNVSNV